MREMKSQLPIETHGRLWFRLPDHDFGLPPMEEFPALHERDTNKPGKTKEDEGVEFRRQVMQPRHSGNPRVLTGMMSLQTHDGLGSRSMSNSIISW